MRQRNGMLYPVLLVAAIVVIVFSIIGIAIMTDMLPGALSPDKSMEKHSVRQEGKPAAGPSRGAIDAPPHP
jgi:hypothetical protein